jgi:hypothetical protein
MFLVLHPRHKLEYFKKHNWEASWINTAHQIVHDEFARSYASLKIQDNKTDMQVDNHEVVSYVFLLERRLCQLFQVTSKTTNIFDELPDLAPALLELRDELNHYLATDVEDVRDGLMWWYERRTTFPRLSRMARDYLSIPGKS